MVSIVIPTRNRLELLAQTLHTVLMQKDVDLEAIVVDEASSDDTSAWLEKHPDPRVRTVRHEQPQGLSRARNAGLEVARGPWIGFVDDDDLWMPTKLSAQLEAAERAGALWAFVGSLMVFTDNFRLLDVSHPSASLVVDNLVWRNYVPGGGSNVIVCRKALEEVGGFEPGIDIVADWDMYIRLLKQLGEPAAVEETLMAYRIHGGNMSKNVDSMLEGLRRIEERHAELRGGEPIDWPSVYEWLGPRALRDGARVQAARLAWRSLRTGHPRARRRLVRTMIPLRPRDPIPHPAMTDGWLDRVRPRKVVPWPDGTDTWLRSVLEVRP